MSNDKGLTELAKSRLRLETWCSHQAKEFQKNSKITTFNEIGSVYRIDKNTPKNFVPRMPLSAFNDENITTPRITTSPTLLGCLLGYSPNRISNEFLDHGIVNSGDDDEFRGGYEISELEYDVAIKPNDKLICEASRTEEIWLVSYDSDHVQYKPKKIGKIIVQTVTYTAPQVGSKHKYASESYTFLVEVNKPEGIKFSQHVALDEGYWRVFVALEEANEPSVFHDNKITSERISKSEYDLLKKGTAAMLSYKTNEHWMKW